MAIEIARGVAQRLVRDYSGAVLQVRTAETDGATRALNAAAEQIWTLGTDETESPKYISGVIPTHQGPMLAFDFGEDFPTALIKRIPELTAAALQAEGVLAATVCCPRKGGSLDQLSWYAKVPYPPGAGLLLWAPVGRTVPERWIELTMAWLSDVGGPNRVSFSGNEFPLDRDTAPGLLRQVADARSGSCLMVAGDFGDRIRTAHLTAIFTDRLTLVERGPAVDRVRTAEVLAELGRGVAGDVEYAAIDLDVAEYFNSTKQFRGYYNGMFDHRGTELVEGPFWWQLLGEGHLARLADPAAARPLAVPGRYELIHGRPEQWLPDRASRAELQRSCRELLANCFSAE